MIIEAIATGKTLVEAQEAAVAGLGDIGEANVEFEILAQPKAKTLGIFGGADAKVRSYVEGPDAPKKEAKKQEVKTKKIIPKYKLYKRYSHLGSHHHGSKNGNFISYIDRCIKVFGKDE